MKRKSLKLFVNLFYIFVIFLDVAILPIGCVDCSGGYENKSNYNRLVIDVVTVDELFESTSKTFNYDIIDSFCDDINWYSNDTVSYSYVIDMVNEQRTISIPDGYHLGQVLIATFDGVNSTYIILNDGESYTLKDENFGYYCGYKSSCSVLYVLVEDEAN